MSNERLLTALAIAAKAMKLRPECAVIFERLETEIETRERRANAPERARQLRAKLLKAG